MPISAEQWRVSVGQANASRSLRPNVTGQSKRKLTPWDILAFFFTALLGAMLFPSMMTVSNRKWHVSVGLAKASRALWSHDTSQCIRRRTSWNVVFSSLLDAMQLSGGDRRATGQRKGIPKGMGTVGDPAPSLVTAVRRKQLLIIAGDVETNPGPDMPTLTECLRFQGRERRINLPQEISVKYYQFGCHLLDDGTGATVRSIAHKHWDDAEQVTLEILKGWIAGRGKHPVTWKTLAQILHDIDLSTLASEIEASKYQEDTEEIRGVNDIPPNQADAQAILEEALENGYIDCQIWNVLVTGNAGSGKTTLMHRLFGKEPPSLRHSTPLAEAAVRAISRKTVGTDQFSWFRVTPDELMGMLGGALKAGVPMEGRKLPSGIARVAVIREPHDQKGVSSSKKELVQLVERSQGSKRFLELQWIHFIDSGGQPQFHEVLPAFIRSITTTIFVMKLSERLDEHPVIKYYDKNGQICGKPFHHALSNEQMLQCCVRTILSRLSRPEEHSKTLIVGTHRDQESSCSESRTAKNRKLIDMLMPSLQDQLVHYRLGTEVIFPINAKKPKEQDYQVCVEVRKQIEDKKNAPPPCKIPIGWFLLEQDIIKASKGGVISRTECLGIAALLNINGEALTAALQYFDDLHIFLYYPSVLPELVFSNPQILLDKVTELVHFSYSLHICNPPGVIEGVRQQKQNKGKATAFFSKLVHFRPSHSSESLPVPLEGKWLQFRDKGIVTLEMLQDKRFSAHYIPDLFTPADLIKLLQHLLIVAPLSDTEYFMPSLLQMTSPDELVKKLPAPYSSVPPLLVHFPAGCAQNGVFCVLVVYLLSKCHWKFAKGTLECVSRNCICFQLPDTPVSIALVDSFSFFKFSVEAPDPMYPKVCPKIREAIFSGVGAAARVLKYSNSMPKPAFLCSKCSSESPPHAATPAFDGCYLVCTKSESVEPLTEQHTVWLDLKLPVPKNDQANRPTLIECIRFRGKERRINIPKEIGSKYREFGLFLLEDYNGAKIRALAHKYMNDANKINLEILEQWINGKGKHPVTWKTLIEVLRDIKISTLAEEIECIKLPATDFAPSSETIPYGFQRHPLPHLYSPKPTQKQLLQQLYNTSTLPEKWHPIGIYLEIPNSQLIAIEAKHCGDPQKCLMAMLTESWLPRVSPPPTWAELVKAVEFVGYPDVAQKLRDKFCPKPTQKQLLQQLYNTSTLPEKWHPIGIYLEIPNSQLIAIDAKHRGDPQKCLMAMLTESWLPRVSPPPTWAELVKAVEFVGYPDVAQKLRDKFCNEMSGLQSGQQYFPQQLHPLSQVYPPKISQHPESKLVATGASTTFTVEASGDDLQFQWRKDCMDLSNDDRYHKTDTDTLHIAGVGKGDNKARYQCLVKNDVGKDLSREAVLTVIDPPKISQQPENKSVATGASTTFTVEASGDDLQFQWRKDGKDLCNGRKYHDTKTHTLHIKDVEKSDEGSYQCLVKNNVREKLSEEADLAVNYLKGLNVIGEISILITSKDQTFHWVGYGLKLHIPQGALPVGLKQCELTIKVGIFGQFTLPQKTSLVSAVYWLHSEYQREFCKPLIVKIQHCATSSQTSRLSFAKCSHYSLPYNFEILEEGDFSADAYGCIQLRSFSLFTVLRRLRKRIFGADDVKYYARVYYLWRDESRREIHFVITKDLEAHATVVKQKYNDDCVTIGPHLPVEFEASSISLDLPFEGVTHGEGWKLLPLFHPEITKKHVDSFETGQEIPYCQIRAEWTKQGKPSRLTHAMTLVGAKGPNSYFYIELDCISPDTTGGKLGHDQIRKIQYENVDDTQLGEDDLQEVRSAVANLAGKWKDLGISLGVRFSDLDAIHSPSPSGCLREMLAIWLRQSYSVEKFGKPTWKSLVKAVEDNVGGNNPALAQKIAKEHPRSQ